MVRSRRELAIFLSKLLTFSNPNQRLEQYSSDGNSAAALLWQAFIDGNIKDKYVIDLGCGTGILGIGALLLGARHVEFIDIDASVHIRLKENLEILKDNWEIDITDKWMFTNANVTNTQAETDSEKLSQTTIVSNPPFGTRVKHADKTFLQAAIKRAKNIYSMHKSSTEIFVKSFARDNTLKILWNENISFQLKNTMPNHTKKLERVEVTIYHLEKN